MRGSAPRSNVCLVLEAQCESPLEFSRAVRFLLARCGSSQDQAKAMELIDADSGLKGLRRIEAPLFDLEIRGVPALRFMGDQVWT